MRGSGCHVGAVGGKDGVLLREQGVRHCGEGAVFRGAVGGIDAFFRALDLFEQGLGAVHGVLLDFVQEQFAFGAARD